ncbi:MAG: hypothetical protein HC880_21905 [Bacteroidia bacterium]|nr:hypothetical protein [Bacteroidia bacterium]
MKTTEELAHRLIDFCNQLEFLKAYEALYAPEAESIDPFNKINPHLVGLDNLIENEKKVFATDRKN